MPDEQIEADYLVIGSGIGGLSFALAASEHGKVVIATKRAPDDANTSYAQGGIASVLAPDDSFAAHVDDTLKTGGGLCRKSIVELCVGDGPESVRALIEYGVAFSREPRGDLDLTREGGHTARRVAHAGDITGREIERALLEACRARPDRITMLPNHMAIDLLTTAKYSPAPSEGPKAVFGAYLFDKDTRQVKTAVARATVLASGGCGKVYLYTTNPDVATGDGVAMAYRAGAQIANMEFIQFHPTALYEPRAKSYLISEALRGEGGVLRLQDGTPFMKSFHEMESLAPRDVVARAIDAELKRTGDDFVHLDMTHLDPAYLVERFPNIHAECMRYGIDMRTQPIPVVPAAHYSCGGVDTDENGRTSVPNLYAVGEVACTGLHGANRLASNSLLEGAVFGRRAAADARNARSAIPTSIQPWSPGSAAPPHEAVVVSQNWDEIRRLMWNYVGIVRTGKRLERARRRIELIREEIREYYWDFLVTSDLLELRNLALVAHLIVESARRRRESRGLHYTLDYPNADPQLARDTLVSRSDGPFAT